MFNEQKNIFHKVAESNKAMRILWFTNTPMPEVYEHLGLSGMRHGGPWMKALLDCLRSEKSLEIQVITLSETLADCKFSIENVVFRNINIKKKLHAWNTDRRGISQLHKATAAFNPDVIHFHGSELQYIELLKDPVTAKKSLVSLQGIWTLYAPKVKGNLTFWDLLRATSILELLRGKGQFHGSRYAKLRSKVELESLAFCKHFLGRTEWDKQFVNFYCDKSARYYHSGEILRRDFYEFSWNRNERVSFNYIFTNVSGPIKGVEDILFATALLAKDGYPVKLKLAGYVSPKSAYGRHLLRIIEEQGLSSNVVFLGYLSAEKLAKEMSSSTAFISASYSDNSPNSVAEAQIVGIPVIASGVGGVLSMVENGKTGLTYAVGESHMLAAKMLTLATDLELSRELSRAAKVAAIIRHDPKTVAESVLSAYQQVSQ